MTPPQTTFFLSLYTSTASSLNTKFVYLPSIYPNLRTCTIINMACGTGCCGPPAAASSERTAPTQTPIREDVDSCCGDVSSMAGKDPDQPGLTGAARDELAEQDGKPRLTILTPCQDTCCDEPSKEVQDGARREVKDANLDDCCAPNLTEPACNKDCCSIPEPPRVDDIRVPSCCEGKAAPCCDQSCLDRLALRECANHEPALAASHGKPADRLHAPYALLTLSTHSSDRLPRVLRLQPRQR